MARVYSAQLFAASALGAGTNTIGGPSAGEVWVVRHMTARANAALSTPLNGFQVQFTTGVGLWVIGSLGVAPVRDYHWSGRHVLNDGDVLEAFVSDAITWSLLVSGYALALP